MIIRAETPWGLTDYSAPHGHVEEAEEIIKKHIDKYKRSHGFLSAICGPVISKSDADKAIRAELEALERNRKNPALGQTDWDNRLVSLKSVIKQVNECLGLPEDKSVAVLTEENGHDIQGWLIVDKGEDAKITPPVSGQDYKTLAELLSSNITTTKTHAYNE